MNTSMLCWASVTTGCDAFRYNLRANEQHRGLLLQALKQASAGYCYISLKLRALRFLSLRLCE